ncbi:MAG: PAS domain-containing protein [Fulvivirga sp.]
MQGSEEISKDLIQPFHNKVHKEADGIIRYFIIGYFVFGLFLSIFHESWSFGIVMGGISLSIYYLCRSLIGGTLWFRLIVSFLLWNFTVQYIIQMHGMYEMHFFYFISLTVLLFYEDWRIILPASIYAIGTFLYMFYLQLTGSEFNGYLENVPELTYKNVILHLGILIFYAGICILWSKLQKAQTRDAGVSQLHMEEQLKLMDTNINFANSISHGNLNAEYAAESADKLGESLMNMRDSLVEASDREAKEKFVNVGLASIGEILRNNNDNLTELCDQVIGKLVNYMNANQGGIFIIHKNENTDEQYLELKACRAYERKKFLEKRIEIGQGLVGQAAIERQTIHMKEFPEDYINITSGLGLANPNSLIIVPLKSNEEIVGVIEMASFEDFSETDVEFLEKVGESIASTVISAQTNQQTKELLEQSKQMTEEMQAQEEEMRQNMEEMQATQEEMGRSQRELAEKEANLNALINNTSDSIITIDKDYKVIVMNDVVKNRYKGTQYEGLGEGSNALDMLGDVRDEWKAYYDRALHGENLNFTLKSSVKGENSWREYFINPIRDNSGVIVGASIFSRDISDKMRMQEEMKQRGFVLDAMINNTSDTYFAIDSEYKIIVANEIIKKRFEESGITLNPGEYIFDKLPADAEKVWRERYDRALAGEHFVLEEERPTKDKVLYLRVYCDPIKNENDEVIGASVISRDVTERKEAMDKVAELTSEISRLKK